MVTINKALDNLIDALAGSDVPVTGSKATRVDELASMIEDGTIVIGGGGGGVFTVNITVGDEIVADKTYAEIVAAVAAGDDVFARFATGTVIPLAGYDEESALIHFTLTQVLYDEMLNSDYAIAEDGSITVANTSYDLSSLVVE